MNSRALYAAGSLLALVTATPSFAQTAPAPAADSEASKSAPADEPAIILELHEDAQ